MMNNDHTVKHFDVMLVEVRHSKSRFTSIWTEDHHYHRIANPKFLPSDDPMVYELPMTDDLEKVTRTKKFKGAM